MSRKVFYLTVLALGIYGCGAGNTPTTSTSPVITMTKSGGAVLPGGVPLPPSAVQAGAAKTYQHHK